MCAGLLRNVCMLALGCTAMAQPDSNGSVGLPLPSTAFQQSVERCGGRVDFVFGDDRPFAQCHASTLVEAADGTLLCAWFGGTKEKHPDVAIWYARYSDGHWSSVERLAKVNQTAHWNPVLFRDEGRTIYAFFKVGPEIAEWRTYWTRSEDDGRTWTEPTELVTGDEGGRGPVRTKPIVLTDGSWVAGASTEKDAWKAFADRSEDRGRTWHRSADFDMDVPLKRGRGAIQPTLWESTPGHVHALLRTTEGYIARADSVDNGRTWCKVYRTDLPNPNSGIDVLALSPERILLVYNPVSKNWGPRTPLTLAESRDNGKTWRNLAHLEDDPDPKAEFSYPAIVRTQNGVAISYTYQRRYIRCWRIPMAALPE